MKKKLFLLAGCSLFVLTAMATTIIVKNAEELKKADQQAKPGDIIILQNGIWNNVIISLSSNGTKEQPITYKAQTAGKVMVTGKSRLALGGNYIVVDGLYFTKGFAGDDAVISYRINKDKLANNCRVMNCVINDFNNPLRMDENNWILFYGKNNRLDHCSVIGKKNMGVLLAVILDDERSRENFHSIDHNYFGKRIPLASNGGEIIRVGVSQHCQFNSNTQISNNFFDRCDGETEVVSIKSCSNSIEENVFKECQGSMVLRHGDNNLVAGNFFLGNDKPGSGGVRVINKGQKVISNIFYKCRGVDFRSPLAIMNGIPNSPANRYVQVTEADIQYNTFYECAPITFGEGSDAERTLPPDKVIFGNNTFYNTRDSIIYKIYDDIKGISFGGNKASKELKQVLLNGFDKINLPKQKPVFKRNGKGPQHPHVDIIPLVEKESYLSSGASWFEKKSIANQPKPLLVNCATVDEVYKQLETNLPVIIKLTSLKYQLSKPFVITKPVQFTGNRSQMIKLSTGDIMSVFVIGGNGDLTLQNLSIDGSGVRAGHFISSDSAGSSDHYNLTVHNCSIENLDRANGCQNIFYAYRSMVADSLNFHGNAFSNNRCNGIMLTAEKEDKGYYNAEKIFIGHNNFTGLKGELMNIYRGGNDESTLGPQLYFSHNRVSDCQSIDTIPLIRFTGVQVTAVFSNHFTNCNTSGTLIGYKDTVRARHLLEKNKFVSSGQLSPDKFVVERDNTRQ